MTTAALPGRSAHRSDGSSGRSGRAGGRLARHEARWAYVFLAPWIVGLLVFTVGPMVASLVLSFTDYDLVSSPRWAGTANYAEVVQDPRVRTSLVNTLVYTALHVPLSVALALGLALLLARLARSSAFFRTVVYLPVMTPPVAVGAMFLLLLNGQYGLVNDALSKVGITGPDWLTDPAWVKPGLVLMSLWSVGGTAVILLAALKAVPTDLYEAARLDGAGAWQTFRSITLPMVSGTVYFVVIVNTIASLQAFAEVYTMFFGNQATQETSSDSALLYVVYLFQQAFQNLRMGYASALAWLLFLVVLVVTVVQVRVARSRVYYEGER